MKGLITLSYKDNYSYLSEKDFDDEKKSAKFLSVLEIVIIAVLALVIIFMLGIFLLFAKDGATPKVFGYNIFLSKTSTINDIDKNAAIFARDDMIDDLKSGNVVLCRIGEENITTMLRIQEVIEENGKKYYILRPDTNPENATIKLPQENIIAQAVKQDKVLGNILNFARSKAGILTIVIIPFLIFFILQIVHIIKVGKLNRLYEDEEELDIDDDDVVYSILRDSSEDKKQPPKTEDYLKNTPSVPEELPEIEGSQKTYYPLKNNFYINESGKAEFQDKPVPTATVEDLRKAVSQTKYSQDYPASKNSQSETSSEIFFKTERKGYSQPVYINNYSSTVKSEPVLDPPNVKNASDITIPDKAVQPEVTIAPPPKTKNNKTLEELMQMIDKNIK